jgi:hypothetical protein
MTAAVAPLVLATVLLTAACSKLAVWSAPEKTPTGERTPLALQADGLFWQTLHAGRYENIPEVLTPLKAAYLQDPRDPVTAAHIGWMHIWRLAERARRAGMPPDPGITDDAVLARKYFEEAVRLNPGEARYRGFYASLLMAEGSIHKDEGLQRRGYYAMRDAVAAWPEFNYFTAGYGFSAQPRTSERFREGLEYQWRTLDLCVGEKVDRDNPDFAKYMRLDTKEGSRRACWNSWIAPHNFEGFFLNFGDMLVKAGDPGRAVKVYANARLAPEYARWPYRDVLEERIANAPQYVVAFQQDPPAARGPALMVRSRFACVGCHQQ